MDSRWLANLHSGMECRTWKHLAYVNVHLHPCCHGEVRSLPEIKALVLPDVLHYPNDLQRQHVLPQICGGRETQKGGWQLGDYWLLRCSLISTTMHHRAELSKSVWPWMLRQNAQAASVNCDLFFLTSVYSIDEVVLRCHHMPSSIRLKYAACSARALTILCAYWCTEARTDKKREEAREIEGEKYRHKTHHLHFWKWFHCSERAVLTSYLGFPS